MLILNLTVVLFCQHASLFCSKLLIDLMCFHLVQLCQIYLICFPLGLQYKTEKDGVIETRIERKMVITSNDGDDLDHDAVSDTWRLMMSKTGVIQCITRTFCVKSMQKLYVCELKPRPLTELFRLIEFRFLIIS